MEQGYGQEPTGVAAEPNPIDVATEYSWLDFEVPAGLMPDPQFDGLKAHIQVLRVRPVYATGQSPSVPPPAVVLIHGRTVPGPVVFDLQFTAPGGIELSVQKALAWAGIDTFVPSLLGYGLSTRFEKGLDDPGNASLRGYKDGGACQYPEGCDYSLNERINPLDEQRTMLFVNPLGGQRLAHSSKFRFARTDVWVRDIDQVIEFAIKQNKDDYPGDGQDERKVALVGYSVGGQHVGRTLYAGNPLGGHQLEQRDRIIEKVSRVVFLNSLFGVLPMQPGIGPTEEPSPTTLPGSRPTFPLTLNNRSQPVGSGSDDNWRVPDGSTADCLGRIIAGTPQQVWFQTMANETKGRNWGGTVAAHPTGLNRAPTFSGYGWNIDVAKQLRKPTLVMQGLEDGVLPTGTGTGQVIYNNLEAAENKVLVEVKCASHVLQWEGCTGARCTPASGRPYGWPPETPPDRPWAGPHATLKAALIEWIQRGTFSGHQNGKFTVNESGVASGPNFT